MGAALVTGAGQRVGSAIARALAGAGHAVALHYRGSRSGAEAVAAEITAAGGKATCVRADLTDWDQTHGLIARAAQALGQPIDILINNASTFEDDDAQHLAKAVWQTNMDVNLRAPCLLASQFDALLPRPMEGVVINLIDHRVWKLTPKFFSYTLAKAALEAATKTLAQSLSPRIRVNAIGPGPAIRNARQGESDFARQVEATLLQRVSSPEEIARTVLFLLEARAVTGQMIAVDSGQHLIWRTPDVDGVVE